MTQAAHLTLALVNVLGWASLLNLRRRADAGRNVVCTSHIQICNGTDLCTANRCRQYPGMLRAHYSGAHDANSKRH